MRINLKPMSVNVAWQGKRFKTTQYKQFERDMLLMLPKLKIEFDKPLSVDLTFGFSSKLSDIDNPVKPVLDCLQKKYGFNDRDIYNLTIKKEIVETGKEFIEIKIN